MPETHRPPEDETAFSREQAEDERHEKYKKSPQRRSDIAMASCVALAIGAAATAHFLKPNDEPDQAEIAVDASFAGTSPLEKSVFKVEIPVQKNPARLERNYVEKKIEVFEQTHPDFEVESFLISETRNSVNTVIIIANPKSKEAQK